MYKESLLCFPVMNSMHISTSRLYGSDLIAVELVASGCKDANAATERG